MRALLLPRVSDGAHYHSQGHVISEPLSTSMCGMNAACNGVCEGAVLLTGLLDTLSMISNGIKGCWCALREY